MDSEKVIIVFEESGIKVSVAQQLRIDRIVMPHSYALSGNLRPASVIIETAGDPAYVVNLNQSRRPS